MTANTDEVLRLGPFETVGVKTCKHCGRDAAVRVERYDREGNRLADVVTSARDTLKATRDELTEVLAENARLRRRIEQLERKFVRE